MRYLIERKYRMLYLVESPKKYAMIFVLWQYFQAIHLFKIFFFYVVATGTLDICYFLLGKDQPARFFGRKKHSE